jgi:hypothetical protein
MSFSLAGALTILGMLVGTLGCLELGRQLASRRARERESGTLGNGAVEGAVFALMGLLIAFTFSGAAARFDARRLAVVDEANAIGTAWLRLDLLPAAAQPALREKFRQYVTARMAAFRSLPDMAAFKAQLNRASGLQQEIWTQSVVTCRDAGSVPATTMLLPALNQMFDSASSRNISTQLHPPPLIYVMLGLLVLAGSLLAGYGLYTGKRRDWFHALAFGLVMVIAVYIILDFEFPRVGLISIRGIDQVFVDLLESMKP